MPQLFSKRADSLLRSALAATALVIFGFFPLRSAMENSSFATDVGKAVEQPVPFSHKHHVGDIGINCRFCHSTVEKSSFAGMPATATCLACHAYLWKNAEPLAPVRASFVSKIPLQWNRVNNIPDYVYFNHSIHIAKGIGCESCHGRIDQMPLVYKVNAFHMEDCLECHRHPERFIRPRDRIYDFGWKAGEEPSGEGRRLIAEYGIETSHLTECVTCHR